MLWPTGSVYYQMGGFVLELYLVLEIWDTHTGKQRQNYSTVFC